MSGLFVEFQGQAVRIFEENKSSAVDLVHPDGFRFDAHLIQPLHSRLDRFHVESQMPQALCLGIGNPLRVIRLDEQFQGGVSRISSKPSFST